MFANLIESDSHRRELKRRSSFFLATVAAYAVILFVAGIVSIYAYDARLEAQASSLELLNWVPPVTRDTPPPIRENPRIRRTTPPNAPVDRNARVQERTVAIAPTSNPLTVPHDIGTKAPDVPPVTGAFRIGNRNVDPPPVGPTDERGCPTCGSSGVTVRENATPPAATIVKPQTQRVSTGVLVSKAINLPQPTYPPIAIQIRAQGPVLVQILVGENGQVLTAQPVSGHPTLLAAAREAALRARFTPTILNGVPVKVQGVITYNFILQ